MLETKRNYHPLIIILFASGMLSLEEINQIPDTTKHNWNQFKHENYFGYEWVEKYINQFDDIKDIYKSRFTLRAVKAILKARRGYYSMLGELASNKKLLKNNAESIVTAIKDMADFSGITIKKACKFYGNFKRLVLYTKTENNLFVKSG